MTAIDAARDDLVQRLNLERFGLTAPTRREELFAGMATRVKEADKLVAASLIKQEKLKVQSRKWRQEATHWRRESDYWQARAIEAE